MKYTTKQVKKNFLKERKVNGAVQEGVCPKNCVNGYVRINRLEPVCQIVWQIDLLLKPNF